MASAAQAANWPRLARVWNSLEHNLALRGASGLRASWPKAEPPCFSIRHARWTTRRRKRRRPLLARRRLAVRLTTARGLRPRLRPLRPRDPARGARARRGLGLQCGAECCARRVTGGVASVVTLSYLILSIYIYLSILSYLISSHLSIYLI